MGDLSQLAMYVVGVLGGIFLLLGGIRNTRAGAAIVCLIVFFASISPQAEGRAFYGQTWLFSLQSKRAELYLAASCLLAVVVAFNARFLRTDRISAVAMLMLVINLFAGVLDTRHDPAGGAQRIGLAAVSLGALAMFVSAHVKTWDDFLPLMRALGAVGVLWVGGSLVQAVIDQSQMLVGWQRRFVGLLGNPQGTAVYLGPQSAIVLWLTLNDPVKRMRLFWIALYAILLMMVAWTGSRTGAILTILGAMFMLRARLGAMVFVLPLIGLGLVGVAYFVNAIGIQLPFDRLLSGGDTRSEAWAGLLKDALSTGLLGEGAGGARYVENAYLLGWVIYGPIMLAIMLIQLMAMGVNGIKLWRARHEMPTSARRLVDLIVAYYAMFFVGAQFEWYIVSRIDANICFVVIFSCMGSCLVSMVENNRQSEDWALDAPTQHSGESALHPVAEGYDSDDVALDDR